MRQQFKVAIGLLMGLVIMLAGTRPGVAEAQTITRVSVATGGGQANGESDEFSLSADGRYVAFASEATNLVPGDTNGVADIFVHDRQTGITTRVSVATGGGEANGESEEAVISGNGRFVAFGSLATNLVPGDTNGVDDIFVHDRQTGITTRVSVATGGGQANGEGSDGTLISGDGQVVVFEADSSNLVPVDTNGVRDIFVHDRQTNITTRVSVATGGAQANSSSENPTISVNGRFVAFDSIATNLVPGDTNGKNDVFVHDLQTGITTRVNVTEGDNVEENLGDPALNADGRYVAFESDATNLVPGDTNAVGDLFVYDQQTGNTTRVSVSGVGTQGNGSSGSSLGPFSADGRFVTFSSDATNLVPGDTNGKEDVFIHDRQTGTTTRISFSSIGDQGNGDSGDGWLSADGRFVAFSSDATNLVLNDTNGVGDIFVYDRGVPAGGSSNGTDLNGDGTRDLIFRNLKTTVVAGWLMNGTTILSSAFFGGVPAEWQIAGLGDVNGDGKGDVIWRNRTSGVVAVWLMNGLTIASVGFPGGTSTEWTIQAVGDVNGDGKADLVWRNMNDGVVAIWLMDGATIASSGFLGGVPLEWQIAGIGDVTGEGQEDVFWRNTMDGTVAVWVMNGLALPSVGFPGSAGAEFVIAGVGDVNGDGLADLIWRNSNNGEAVVWLLSGLTIMSTGAVGGLGLEWQLVQVGDMNGDGKADVVWYDTSSGQVGVWLLNGLTVSSMGSPASVSPEWRIAGNPNLQTSPTSLGSGAFSAPTNFAVGDGPRAVAVGDFNADTVLDLAVGNVGGLGSNTVSILLGNGTGEFSSPTNLTVGDNPTGLAIGDFNADKALDLAVADSAEPRSHNVSILLGDGAGGFSAPTLFAVGGNLGNVAVGDFNADGALDLVTANFTGAFAVDAGNVSILLGDGKGKFSAPTNFAAGDGPTDVVVGDFNADRALDLAVVNFGSTDISRNVEGNVSILLGDGSGKFSAPTNFAVGESPVSVAVGDFNADSALDLAVASWTKDNVSILLGDGSGKFSAPTNFAVGESPVSVAVGDFNADRALDLAVANFRDKVSILLGDGAGVFSPPTNFAAGDNPFSVAVGDFNADTVLDLAVANDASDNVSILLGLP